MFSHLKKIVLVSLAFCSFSAWSMENVQFPTLAPMLKQVIPAIVNVAVQGIMPPIPKEDEDPKSDSQDNRQLPGKPRKFASSGSGVIIDPQNGIIVTNDHVVRYAKVITITLNDGRRLKAKFLGGDSETDIAILKIEAKNLKGLVIGDSDKAEVGDFVVAIGNPFDLNSFGNSQSATFGIISALKRSALNIEGIENFIQTDAAINPGNSGGALVTSKGELIGINTAIISPYGGNVGIGFAIPVNMVKDVTQQIIKYGSVHRGLMGIFVQHLTPELAQALGYSDSFKGALVSQVNPSSPAEQAGLQAGDIITQINETRILEATQVKTTISLLRVGAKVNINIMRNNKPMTLTSVVTDVRDHEQKLQASNPFLYGLALRNFEQESPMHGKISGIQIMAAAESSAGWRAGIRPGDVIIGANKQPVIDVKSLQQIATQKKADHLLLQILRGPGAMFLLVD